MLTITNIKEKLINTAIRDNILNTIYSVIKVDVHNEYYAIWLDDSNNNGLVKQVYLYRGTEWLGYNVVKGYRIECQPYVHFITLDKCTSPIILLDELVKVAYPTINNVPF
jgi:hypothetical protein